MCSPLKRRGLCGIAAYLLLVPGLCLADPGGAPSELPLAALSAGSAAAAAHLDEADPRARVLAARALASDPAALEVLAARLAKESDPAVRRAFTDALARLPLSEAQLVDAVRASPVLGARAFAAHALATSRSTAAATALLAATADVEPAVRVEACRALGTLGERGAIDTLLKLAVRDPAAGVREAATAAAERVAAAPTVPPDVTVELARLRSGTPDERGSAARALGESGDRRAFDPLAEVVGSSEPEVQRAAIGALGRLGDARAVPVLVALLPTSVGRTRQAAIGALATLRDESSADPITALLRDPDPASRQLAVRALGWIAPDDLFARLSPAQDDPLEEVRGEVLQVVAHSPAPTRIAALIKALGDPSPFLRAEAVRLCADAGVTDRIPSLLSDPDPLVRLASADALLVLRPTGAAGLVRAAARKAKEPDERARLDEIATRLDSDGLPMPGARQ